MCEYILEREGVRQTVAGDRGGLYLAVEFKRLTMNQIADMPENCGQCEK